MNEQKVSEERLRELIARTGDDVLHLRDEKDVNTLLTELLTLRQSKEWVRWKAGDALPMQSIYITTNEAGYLDMHSADNFERVYDSPIVAYLPEPLPDPYQGGE